MLPQKRRPWEKASTESTSKGVEMKISNTTGQCCTIILLYFTSDAWLEVQRGERVGWSWLKEKGKVRTHCKRHCKLNWYPRYFAGKPLFVILLRTTTAREPWHDFYLRKKGQCFIQALMEHLNDMGSLPFQVVSCELWQLKETKDLWQISSAVFGRRISLTLGTIVLKAAVASKGHDLSLLLFLL